MLCNFNLRGTAKSKMETVPLFTQLDFLHLGTVTYLGVGGALLLRQVEEVGHSGEVHGVHADADKGDARVRHC